MKTKRILNIVLLLGMMLSVSFSANAQLGNLGKKLKNKVEKSVNSTATDKKEAVKTDTKAADVAASEKTTEKTTENTQQKKDESVNGSPYSGMKTDLGTIPDFEKKFVASPEAKAEDPKAADPTILQGYTKSIGDIHALYENLSDKKLFPFQPYYKYKPLYEMDEKTNDDALRRVFEHYMMEILSADLSVKPYDMLQTFRPDDNTYIPITDVPRYAKTTRYLCDPYSIQAFAQFAFMVLPFHAYIVKGSLRYPMDDVNEGIISKKQNMMLPSRDYTKQRDNREDLAIFLAARLLNINDLCNLEKKLLSVVDDVIAKCGQTTDKAAQEALTFYACIYSIEAQEIYNRIIKEHKDYNPDDNEMRQLNLLIAKNADVSGAQLRKFKDMKNSLPAQAFPASKMNNAALLAACVKAARAMYPKEDASAVSIIESEWMIDRDNFGNILRRRVSAWVNIKDPETGKRVARNYGFAQPYQGGGKYGSTIFYGVGTLKGFDIK